MDAHFRTLCLFVPTTILILNNGPIMNLTILSMGGIFFGLLFLSTIEKMKNYPELHFFIYQKDPRAATYTYLKGVTQEEIKEIEHKNNLIEFSLLNKENYEENKYTGGLRIKNI